MLQPLTSEKRIVIAGVIVTTLILVITAGAIRAYAVYRLSTDQAVLQTQFKTMLLDQQSRDDALRKELDSIELTLYTAPSNPQGPVTPKVVMPVVRRASSFESDTYSQLKELRDRITALENWRLKVDRDLR